MHLIHKTIPSAVAALLVFLGGSPMAGMAAGGKSIPNPDFTAGDPIPDGAKHDWNLGPTGARGWIYSNKLETTEARQVLVTTVAPGSPAEGVLEVGDVILGVGKTPFSYDPRTELGKAITNAEARDGRLEVIRWRKGETSQAVISLTPVGAYSPTAPFSCAKSQRVFEEGCEALARKMQENPNAGNGITRCLNALALLASGNEKYLPQIRAQVEWASQYSDLERKTLHAWFYGPANMLLAEYTLATGDRSYLKNLERVTMEIVHGQSEVGSWGHRFVQPEGRLSGYGMMNAPGLPLTASLILAREAGVQNKELDYAIEKSLRLVRFYVGKGSIPYGDHHPWIQTHEDNGKNGIAALVFHLADDVEAARYFSRMSVASHGSERDTGHTGNYFNMLWAMPGVALSGPKASGAWMEEFGWYYDLARSWDGTFQHQGAPQAKGDSYFRWDATGAFLLAYAQPLGEIHLAGRKKSAVADVDANEAADLVEAGKGWSPRTKNETYTDRSEKELVEGLSHWSPVVRDRSATELGRRKETSIETILPLLDQDDLYTHLGACQALVALKGRGAPAVPRLRELLKADDLWLRVKAAEALASIGDAATDAVPELLEMMTIGATEEDPRAMQQRYLCFALFDRRNGLLRRSLDGVDREALYAAVKAGLKNDDGRARGTLGSVYQFLTYEEIEPLLPAIYEAVVEPAPSGIMFADGIRLSGLEMLAKHRIKEGLPLCLEVMNIEAWGKKGRIARCLKALAAYGGSARLMLPDLVKLEQDLRNHRESKSLEKEIQAVIDTRIAIEKDEDPPALRSLTSL
ncbi:MAG: DUF6288 domain-containing protein [Verrucomicrobiales bacterium]|nr:DUF6288 domain-containing protein [Verrucomicrobiales bacterium]